MLGLVARPRPPSGCRGTALASRRPMACGGAGRRNGAKPVDRVRKRQGLGPNPGSRTESFALRDAEAAAKSLRLQVRPAEVRGPEDLEKAFASIAHERPEAL